MAWRQDYGGNIRLSINVTALVSSVSQNCLLPFFALGEIMVWRPWYMICHASLFYSTHGQIQLPLSCNKTPKVNPE